MKWPWHIVYLFLIITALACGGMAPENECEYTRYIMEQDVCLWYKNSEGDATLVCPGEVGYPEGAIVIPAAGLKCEHDFQDLAISRCARWR